MPKVLSRNATVDCGREVAILIVILYVRVPCLHRSSPTPPPPSLFMTFISQMLKHTPKRETTRFQNDQNPIPNVSNSSMNPLFPFRIFEAFRVHPRKKSAAAMQGSPSAASSASQNILSFAIGWPVCTSDLHHVSSSVGFFGTPVLQQHTRFSPFCNTCVCPTYIYMELFPRIPRNRLKYT